MSGFIPRCPQCGAKRPPGCTETTGDKVYPLKKTCHDCGIEKHYAVHLAYDGGREK